MKKKDWPAAYERFQPFFLDAARTHYDGHLERGFKFWATSQVLMDTDASDDELKAILELDGAGDLSLDGVYKDEDAETVVLIQSRFHEKATTIGDDELNGFLSCLKKVLDPEIVVASKNELITDAHRIIKEAVEKEWALRFVFVSSGYLSDAGNLFRERFASSTEVLDSVQIKKNFDVYDIDGLQNLYESHLSPARLNTDVTLSVPIEDRVISSVGGFRVLVGCIPAAELVAAFDQHQYALFKLNPRGPLQATVNKHILATLEDTNKKRLFFHLNNGVTAVCDTLAEGEGESVAIRGFQIVNGCQTTVTLKKAAAIVEGDREIKVLLRVIEGLAGVKDEIATATNTQSRLSAQDFKSNDSLQQDLKNQFDAMPEPIFYEPKRGDWETVEASDRKRYQDAGTKLFRRIKMKDLAQATLAFLGQPGDAKDNSRSIFENEVRYKAVFPDGITAKQLLVPWEVHQIADELCSKWDAFPGATYARYCLTALTGRGLVKDGRLPDDTMPIDEPAVRARIAKGQLVIGTMRAAKGKDYPGHREFFRSSEWYDQIVAAYESAPD